MYNYGESKEKNLDNPFLSLLLSWLVIVPLDRVNI